MKRQFLISSLIFISLVQANAQNTETYRVRQGEIPIEIIPKQEQFRFEIFQEGEIHFFNGNSIPATLNYNYLDKKMKAIGSQGDTVDVTHTYATKYISIGSSLFIRNPEGDYIEVSKGESALKLATKITISLVRVEATVNNGYEITKLSHESVSHAQGYYSDAQNPVKNPYAFPTRENLLFKKEITYYLMDKNHRLHPATWRNFRKVFPQHTQVLKSFVNEHDIDFKRQEDMEKLIAFCEELLD